MPTDTVAVTVDGLRLQVEKGKSVLLACRNAGIDVPSLCFHPKLKPNGSCRICLVEIEGIPGFVSSCTMPVREGMVVRTDTDEILRIRRFLVELLLSSGNHDCESCSKIGSCELQKVAESLGIDARLAAGRDPPSIDRSHPMIHFDRGKCISCWRCIQACNERVVNHALSVRGRAHRSGISWKFETPFFKSSCTSCGECIEVCPTGALTESNSPKYEAGSSLVTVPNTCPYCGVGCQIDVHVESRKNRIVRVSGRPHTPPNDGMLCVKGRFGYGFVSSSKRLSHPLIRKNGKHQIANWDEALDFAADRLSDIRQRHGPDSISGLASARDTNENNYAIMKFMRAVIGTNNIDHCART